MKHPNCSCGRHGSALEHGAAHTRDHARWTRREFLYTGLAAIGTSFLLGATPVHIPTSTPLLARLATLETDRVLVLIQLSGGNDGLNTVVPYRNDLYYSHRPTLAIPSNEVISLTDEMGWHPSLEALYPLWSEGRTGILQQVGYPQPDLSHFRSTDIWITASGSDEYLTTGWAGRYLETVFPDIENNPPPFPPAVQIGGSFSMLFQGMSGNTGMSLLSVDLFNQLASGGQIYDENDVPPTPYGAEMSFVRAIANDSFQYAGGIRKASEQGSNQVEYPAGNALAESLAIVARLIKGQLGSRMYLVSLSGFDTHANQANQHANLLRLLAEAIAAFQADLDAGGWSDRVLMMTFSEFGRRVNQNSSGGTDHGTAAPLFVFGTPVRGGLYGAAPDLENVDETGNLIFETDFRQVYTTILQHWFGLPPQEVASVLGHSFEPVPFIAPATATLPEESALTFQLWQNYPNPFSHTTEITYQLQQPASVNLMLYDVAGRYLRTLDQGWKAAGLHRISLHRGGLPAGVYFYRLQTPEGHQTRKCTIQ